jgi:hypothetical protein
MVAIAVLDRDKHEVFRTPAMKLLKTPRRHLAFLEPERPWNWQLREQ